MWVKSCQHRKVLAAGRILHEQYIVSILQGFCSLAVISKSGGKWRGTYLWRSYHCNTISTPLLLFFIEPLLMSFEDKTMYQDYLAIYYFVLDVTTVKNGFMQIFPFPTLQKWPQTNNLVDLLHSILYFSPSRSDTTPLLNNSTQDRMFDTMSVEIEQLLAKVSKFSWASGPWKASEKTVIRTALDLCQGSCLSSSKEQTACSTSPHGLQWTPEGLNVFDWVKHSMWHTSKGSSKANFNYFHNWLIS